MQEQQGSNDIDRPPRGEHDVAQESVELEEHVPRSRKMAFSLGSFANGLLSGLPFANLTFFYEEKLGLDHNLVSIAWWIFAIWNTLNDPLFSYIIDNTRTRLGRRVPYIRYGSFAYGLTFIFCWFPVAPLDNQLLLFLNLLGALFLLDTMFTIVGCCFFALPNEIAVTAKQRASLTIYSAVFMFLNLVIGLGLPIFLLTGERGVHPLFQPVMLFLGLACAAILFVSSFGIKENMFAQQQPHEGFIEGLRETLKNKPFWIVMIPAFCISLIMPLVQTGLLYYISYVVKDQDITWFLLSFVLMLVAGLGINFKLLDLLKVKKLSILLFWLLTVAFIGAFFLGFNAIAAIVPFAMFGFCLAGALMANGVLMGDVIDNDELITGKRREAIYGGVNAIVTKPGISIANWAFLSIIKAFGFVSPEIVDGVPVNQPQDFTALVGIMVALCLLPAVGTAISAIAMRWYPLDGTWWLEKKAFILELHEKKEREFLESIARENLQ